MKGRYRSSVSLGLLLAGGAVAGVSATGMAVARSHHADSAAQEGKACQCPALREKTSSARERLSSAAMGRPLAFEPTAGVPGLPFVSRGKDYQLAVGPAEAMIQVQAPTPAHKPTMRSKSALPAPAKVAAVRMRVVGGNAHAQVAAEQPLASYTNYLIGNDPSKWRTHVANYSQVRSENVYQGVDVVYHGTQGELEYDFVVKPGSDAGQIRLGFDGTQKVSLNKSGDLVLQTDAGSVRQHKPVAYQETEQGRVMVASSFDLRGSGDVRFHVGEYDHNRPLVIDPAVGFSTYFGGSSDEGVANTYLAATQVEVDTTGIYLGGSTFSTDFVTTQGSYHPAKIGTNRDIFVTKFNLDGASLIYSTFIGGSSVDLLNGMTIDSSGNVIGGGLTQSSDFPAAGGLTSGKGSTQDCVGFKLNAAGTSLTFSGCFGGSSDTEFVNQVAVDSSGNAYFVGHTGSTNFFGTPPAAITSGTVSSTSKGGVDAFVLKLDSSGNKVKGTFIGGGGSDDATGIAIDSSNRMFLGGNTNSAASTGSSFPSTDGSTLLNTSYDAWLAQMDPATLTFTYCTIFGGGGDESSACVRTDGAGNVYMVGGSNSTAFQFHNTTPTPNSVFFNGAQTSNGSDGFLVKLNSSAQPTYMTFLGGTNGIDALIDCFADSSGMVTACGWTQSSNIPLKNSFQTFAGGSYDALVAKYDTTLTGTSSEIYASCLGGTSTDQAYSIAPFPNPSCDNVYIAGVTQSVDFPTLQPYQASHGGLSGSNLDCFLTVLATGTPPTANAGSNQSVTCTGVNTTVTVTGSATQGTHTLLSYFWYVDSNTTASASGSVTSSGPLPSTPISLTVGTHTLTLIVEDACYIRAKSTVTVTVNNQPPVIDSSTVTAQSLTTGAACSGTYTPHVTATLPCGGTVTITGVRSGGTNNGVALGTAAVTNNSSNTFPADPLTGTNTFTITWTATNNSSQTSTATQTITVTDTTAPTLSVAPTNMTATASPAGTTSVTLNATSGYPGDNAHKAGFTDNCGTPNIVAFRDNPGLADTGLPSDLAGSYPLGVSKITWIAYDAQINFTTAFQTVTVHGSDSVSSTFGSDDEGWYVNNNATLSYQSTGGNPGGNVKGTDSSNETWSFFSPSKFGGNQSAAYGNTLTFDLKATGASSPTTKNVTITGGGLTMSTTIAVASTSSFTSYSLALTGGGGTIWKVGGSNATVAQVQQILGSVQTIKIPGAFGNPTFGGSTAGYLDNVILSRSY